MNEHAYIPQPLGFFAADLLARSQEYLSAFEVLADKEPSSLMYARYFLYAHALEVSLKAFLAAKGVPKKYLRRLGHDLEALGRTCSYLDIPDVEYLMVYCSHFHEMNRAFDFRYPSGYNLSVPEPRDCVPVLCRLHEVISPIVELERVRSELFFAGLVHLREKEVFWSD